MSVNSKLLICLKWKKKPKYKYKKKKERMKTKNISQKKIIF